MKIAIVHSVSGVSAKHLKEHLEENGHKAIIYRPYDDNRFDYREFDYVFSFGYSGGTDHKARFNTSGAVSSCISKPITFSFFKKANVPSVEFTTEYDKIPKTWEQVCCRTALNGKKAEGIGYHFREDVPRGVYKLFTEVYHGKDEYRVMYFRGWVGIYHKTEENGIWTFNKKPNKGFEKLIKDARKAAEALNIDYVGFDVLAKNKRSYVFLEANSGAALTPEASVEIVTFFNNLEG